MALFAAACGDDGDETTDSGADDGTTTTAEAEPDEEATTTTAAEPEEEATTTTTEPEEEIVLTDSFRGVTSTSIKIGVPTVDTTLIGWDPDHESADIWQAAADRMNDEGGVLGRMIDLVVIPYDPRETASQDATCSQLSEDEEVFLVMGVMIREAALCYTEINDTAAINTYQSTSDIVERSAAPFIVFAPLPERLVETQVDAIIESGVLDGRTVAFSAGGDDASLQQANAMRDLLETGGVEVGEVTQYFSPSSDQGAIDRELDVNVEIWRSSGADAVIGVGAASVATTGALSRNSWDGLYIITDASGTDIGLYEGFGYSTDALVGSYAVVPPDEADLYEAGQAGVVECVEAFEAAYDDDAPVDIRPEDPRTGTLGVVVRACQALELFKLIAEEAGADLTYDSFNEAADGLGEATVTGVLGGSLGPGKRDFVDAGTALFEYDEELGRFVIA